MVSMLFADPHRCLRTGLNVSSPKRQGLGPSTQKKRKAPGWIRGTRLRAGSPRFRAPGSVAEVAWKRAASADPAPWAAGLGRWNGSVLRAE